MGFYRQAKRYLFIAFVVVIALCLLSVIIFGQEFAVEAVLFAQSLGIWLPLSFILIYIVATIFFPTTPFMALAGMLFGFKYGLLYTTIAGFVSAFITFYTSRTLGREFVDELLSIQFLDRLEKLDEKIGRHGILAIVVLRILPVMPFNVLNLLMGVSKVKARDYAVGTILGLAPSNVFAVYFGTLIISVLQ